MKLSSNQLHLGGADGIRAIACLAVIFHHIAQRLSMETQSTAIQNIQQFLMAGNSGVSIFFVLSGFLLSFPFWKSYLDGAKFPSISQYMFRRAARIVPGYYLVFFVCIVLILLLNLPTEHFLLRTIAGLTFTSGLHYITFFPNDLNGPLWSISFEVFCYILMPLFMACMFVLLKKRSFLQGIMFWFCSLALIMFINELIHLFLTPSELQRGWQYGNIGGAKFWMPNYNPIGFFAHFTIGIMTAGVATKLQSISTRLDKWKSKGLFDIIGGLSLVLAISLLWLLRGAPEFSGSWQQQPYFFPYFALLMALPLAVGSHTLLLHKLLDNHFFKFTAKISFGLYLWHYLFITLVNNYWAKDYHYMGVTSLDRWVLISLAIIVASYIIATISYYAIEKPIIEWSRTKKRIALTNTTSQTEVVK